jgi:hypothetical protein
MLQREESQSKIEHDDPIPEAVGHLNLDEEKSEGNTVSLSLPLQLLFALNGATLSLPSTALMYIVNTRAAVPIVYLSLYGALSFLPNSLKPLYAYLSDFFPRRDNLLTGLLLLSGVSIAATSLVPTGGVTFCFLIAVIREVFSAWPEFLLGVSMLEEAAGGGHFDTNAALFQAQAATARNIGSWCATLVGFIFFLYRYFHVTGEQLSDFAVNLILVTTGSLNVFGAVFAWHRGVGYRHFYTRLETAVPITFDDHTRREPVTHSKLVLGDATVILTLQLLGITFALRSPLVNATSALAWDIILVLLVATMIAAVGGNYDRWSRAHRVGFFLIVRHAIPSSEFLMGSFVYELFQSTPMVLQLFGVFSGAITTLSSWSYGRLLAPFGSGTQFMAVIVCTTVAASLFSLLDIVVTRLDTNDNQLKMFATVMVTSLFTTFSNEWSFLPSVILATTAVDVDEDVQSNRQIKLDEVSDDPEAHVSYQQMKVTCCECKGPVASIGMQYGALVSCLDFGDQIGSWLTMPLVAALGISRENDWDHMGTFILTTALLSLIPLALLPTIRN